MDPRCNDESRASNDKPAPVISSRVGYVIAEHKRVAYAPKGSHKREHNENFADSVIAFQPDEHTDEQWGNRKNENRKVVGVHKSGFVPITNGPFLDLIEAVQPDVFLGDNVTRYFQKSWRKLCSDIYFS